MIELLEYLSAGSKLIKSSRTVKGTKTDHNFVTFAKANSNGEHIFYIGTTEQGLLDLREQCADVVQASDPHYFVWKYKNMGSMIDDAIKYAHNSSQFKTTPFFLLTLFLWDTPDEDIYFDDSGHWKPNKLYDIEYTENIEAFIKHDDPESHYSKYFKTNYYKSLKLEDFEKSCAKYEEECW